MNIPNQVHVPLLLVAISVVLTGCWSLRSAEGLSGGEVNVNYIPPVAGSARWGVTDNVEVRFVQAFENQGYDLFLHTHNTENAWNAGIAFGVTKLANDPANGYTSVVVSTRVSRFVTPYVSAFVPYITEEKRMKLSAGYASLGADIRIPLWRSLTFLLTPEIGGFKGGRGGVYSGSVYATGNVGFILALY